MLVYIQNEIKEKVKCIPGLRQHNYNDYITDNFAQPVLKCPALFPRMAAHFPTYGYLRALQHWNIRAVVIWDLRGHRVFTYYSLLFFFFAFALQYWKISDVCVVALSACFSNWKPRSESQHTTWVVAVLCLRLVVHVQPSLPPKLARSDKFYFPVSLTITYQLHYDFIHL